jgi:hypothetical protein
MNPLFILLGVFLFQLILASITSKDAYERGHDSVIWFVLVLLFGILSILVYLLTRNDRRLPKPEQSEKSQNHTSPQNVAVAVSGFIILVVFLGGLASVEGIGLMLMVFGLLLPLTTIYWWIEYR